MKRLSFILLFLPFFLGSCYAQEPTIEIEPESVNKTNTMKTTEEEWKEKLTPEQYEVLRNKGTEAPYSGKYVSTTADGTYVCAACGTPLFSSKDKYDAGCGWPSFTAALEEKRIIEKEDRSAGMVRTEILCAHCGGHLGHVFNDGPKPGGLRYCVNSVSLDFKPAE